MSDRDAIRRRMIIEHVEAAQEAGLTPSIPEGMTVAEWLETRAIHPTLPRGLPGGRNAPKRRSCLLCSHDFLSAGAHHRVCPVCRDRDTSNWEFAA